MESAPSRLTRLRGFHITKRGCGVDTPHPPGAPTARLPPRGSIPYSPLGGAIPSPGRGHLALPHHRSHGIGASCTSQAPECSPLGWGEIQAWISQLWAHQGLKGRNKLIALPKHSGYVQPWGYTLGFPSPGRDCRWHCKITKFLAQNYFHVIVDAPNASDTF